MIIAFSSTYFETNYIGGFESGKWGARLGFILCFQNAVLLTVYIVNLFLPKIPEKVSHAIERHFYVERTLNGETHEEMYNIPIDDMPEASPYNHEYEPDDLDLDLYLPTSP